MSRLYGGIHYRMAARAGRRARAWRGPPPRRPAHDAPAGCRGGRRPHARGRRRGGVAPRRGRRRAGGRTGGRAGGAVRRVRQRLREALSPGAARSYIGASRSVNACVLRASPVALALLAALVGCGGPEPLAGAASAPAETAAPDGEWVDLFDGESLAGWRAFGGGPAPSAWRAEDGVLRFDPEGGERGDLVAEGTYGDFELELEYRIAEVRQQRRVLPGRRGRRPRLPLADRPRVPARRRLPPRRGPPLAHGRRALRPLHAHRPRGPACRRVERRPHRGRGRARRALAERRAGRRGRGSGPTAGPPASP